MVVSLWSDNLQFYGFPVLLHKAKVLIPGHRFCFSVACKAYGQKLGFCVPGVHQIIFILGLYFSKNVFHQGLSLAQKEASLVFILPVSPHPTEYLCQNRRQTVLQDTSRGK